MIAMSDNGFNEKWLEDYKRRTGCKVHEYGQPLQGAVPSAPQRKSKYGNIKTTVDGRTFDSKHEAERYGELKLLWQAGVIMGFACQVPFMLPGGVVYKADFVVLYPDHHFEVEDAKSEATARDQKYRIKKRLMLDTHGIEIKEV